MFIKSVFLNFGSIFFHIIQQVRKIYLNSPIYNKKISKIDDKVIIFKPSQNIFNCLIRFDRKKYNIEDFSLNSVWKNSSNLSSKNFKNLHSFFWLFTLDLRSSQKITQNVIYNWIEENDKYKQDIWELDILSKRIIAWISNSKLTYENSDNNYKLYFNNLIKKQTNHLINEINKSKLIDDKLIGCSSIILVGLCYQNEKKYLSYGSNLLKKISKETLDDFGFPKSRNIKQLVFYLKYFILIREWYKESRITIPEHIDETIYYLGQGYAFIWQNINCDILFNGNNISDNYNFDNYLKRLGYKFKNENRDFGEYIILRDKKIGLTMDAGSTPNSSFSKDYQSGALSIEIISNGKKLISNCGFFKEKNSKLNELSKSTATHNTLTIDDNSSCKFDKKEKFLLVKKGLKILKKNSVYEKNYWKISASHDGYQKKYNTIHEREIEFFPEQITFIGTDKIIKKINKNYKFDIRFHVEPNVKLMKTQDNKTILIELDDEGWKFTCDNFDINIDNGLYFGKKNSYKENQNIFISGINNEKEQIIKWEISKL